MVAARVPPRYAFGDRGHFKINKTYRVSCNFVFPRLLHLTTRMGSPDAADLRGKSLVCGYSILEAVTTVLVLPSATPEERSERGSKDQTVAARVPPWYAFGDRGHFKINKTYRVSCNFVFPRLLQTVYNNT
ncbi:hypothetical protein NDU88_002568 [Pleurodeles waltl]|uniref:Uncharacterized protein n=1 Tax=Pleurodeles waltl TaxID=8319 RepID=A0AAV7RFY4_PLEWA|nr:hypothetical protein NDU88_002568 [Pleurodeles waltl]